MYLPTLLYNLLSAETETIAVNKRSYVGMSKYFHCYNALHYMAYRTYMNINKIIISLP